MGYRTDGRWVIKGHIDDITAAWASVVLTMPPYPNEAPNDTTTGLKEFRVYRVDDTGYIRFSFEGWKWYSTYPEVQWYERVWRELRECPHIAGKRLHIGEDSQYEELNFDNCQLGDYMDVDVSISVSFSDYEPNDGDSITPDDTQPINP